MHKDITPLHCDYTAIVDMGMIWRLAMPESEEKSLESDEPFKYKDYGDKVADMIMKRHPTASTIICVNDVCNSYRITYYIFNWYAVPRAPEVGILGA